MKLFLNFIIIFLLISISAYLRLRGVTKNGIIGADTFQYLDIALMWRDGQFVLNNDLNEYRQYFRPVFYALNTLSFYLFGVNDYAMRLLIGIFESFNAVLVFFVAKNYFRNNIFALALLIVYLFVPPGISLSQHELPHTYSVTFVLLAYLVLVIGLRKAAISANESSWYNFFSGIFAGAAATTHGSTTFLGPVLIALIGIDILIRIKSGLKSNFVLILKQGAIFTCGFFLNYLFWGAIVGYEYMAQALISETSHDSGADLSHFSLFLTYLTDGPRLSLSVVIFYLFYIAIALFVVKLLITRKTTAIELSPFVIFLFFCLLFSLVFKNVFFERLFLPINIFVLLILFKGLELMLSKQHSVTRLVVVIFFTCIVAYQTFIPKYPALANISAGNDKGGPKFVFDAIGKHVTPQSKLLLAPYLQWMHRPQYQAPVYFGENALYLMQCENNSLAEYIQQQHIKYIFISKDLDRSIAESNQTRYKNLGSCTGMDKSNYNLERDLEVINEYLINANAEKIAESKIYGTLYSF